MKKFFTLIQCLFVLNFFVPVLSNAQAYIQYSHQATQSSSGFDLVRVANGEAYVLQFVDEMNNNNNAILKKYAVDGTLLYSVDIIAHWSVYIRAMQVINGEVYLLGGKPTNVGCCGLAIQAIKVSATGSIIFNREISDTTSPVITNPDSDIYPEILVKGNEWIIAGTVKGMNFPTTMGGLVKDDQNLYIIKLDATTGQTIRSMAIPVGYQFTNKFFSKIIVENDFLCIAQSTIKNDLPITIGNLPDPMGFASHVYVRKMNLTDFSTVFSRYVSVNSTAAVTDFLVKNGEYHITGKVTAQTAFYTKLYADGSLAVSKDLELAALSVNPDCIKASNNHVYICGTTQAGNQQYSVFAFKLNPDGSIVYLKNNPTNIYSTYYHRPVEVVGDDLYIAGVGAAANYPVTNNSTYANYTGYLTHYGPSGNLVFSTFLNPVYKMEIQGNKIYIAGTAVFAPIPSTDGSVINGPSDCFVTVLKPNGSTVYHGYFGGTKSEPVWDFDVDNDNVFLIGATLSPDYPTTEPAALQNADIGDAFITKISFCPNRYNTSIDTLSPISQTICKNGLAGIISGVDLIIPGDSLPPIYTNGVQTLQRPVTAIYYQWQKSLSLSGPWTNIPNATARDYQPVIGTVTEYFRRQSFLSTDCNTALIHTSDTAIVIAGPQTSPTVGFGGPILTCPASPVQLDGITAVSGGQPPYSYTWDLGLPAISNPVVSPAVNTVYNLLVTDVAGCQQLGTVVVTVYKADAGIDNRSCGGMPVRIGTAPLPTVTGTGYAWTPAVGLNDSNVAQPMANPLVETTYTLTVNITKPDGTVCVTQDPVKVKPVAAPADPHFAGIDKTICYPDSVLIGNNAEPGFNYSWTPATYIRKPDTAQTYYNPVRPGELAPLPDPATLYLDAKKDGCSFIDTVLITTVVANAGVDLCRGGILGIPDHTPGITELYSWSLLSGPGNFIGPTNTPQVHVSGSAGTPSMYELTVSYNGKSCQSGAMVYNNCGQPTCFIIAEPSPGCAVNLKGYSPIADGIYTWAPQIGLSAYTGNTVELTDQIPRTYTLTVTSAHDSALSCSVTQTTSGYIEVVFSAPDTSTCANVPVMLGAPPVAGYNYLWEGAGLSNYFISNPVATIGHTSYFYVTVRNANGCETKDTVLVYVPNFYAYAGEDRTACSNAVVTLGSDQLPNTSYTWTPATAAWQNGTNQFSAQPQVLATVTATYTLTINTAGCSSSDEINITVNNSPQLVDAPDEISCAGSGVWIGSQEIPGVIYQWSPLTGVDDPGSSFTYVHPTSTTTYTLTAIFPGDCSLPATDEVTVTVRDLSFSMPDIHFCPQDGAVQLGANVSSNMNYYEWQPANLVTDAGVANPQTVNSLPANITNLILTVGDDFCYYSDTLQLIPSTSMPVVSADRTVCKDQPVHVGSTLNTTGATTSYQWSPADYLDDPTSANPVFTGTAVGTYQYVVVKTDNSIPCYNSDTVVLTVVDILPPFPSTSVCRNSCVSIGTNPLNGVSYSWNPVEGLSNPSSSNTLACVDSNAVSYILTASDGYGCVATDTVVLSVLPYPGISASVPGVTACVGDTNAGFTPSVSSGSYSWLWSPDNNTLSNIYIPNPLIQTAIAGTQQYTLEVTDNGTGCTQTIPVSAIINECPPVGSIGNFVWMDLNKDGFQDIGEPGAAAVVVRLYNEAGYLMATTITDLNGNYDFGNTFTGNNYHIVFETPVGYQFTIQNSGSATASNNSKPDASGLTGTFNLPVGGLISNMDAGIIPKDPVPVSLLSFNARLHDNKEVILDWQTAHENNCQFFYIERSADAFSFNTIGRLNGHGTTSLNQNYQFTDHSPLNGYNYYRLRQTDFDGRFSWSHVETIKIIKDQAFTIYYSNASNSIHIHMLQAKNNIALRLLAPNGQLVASKKEKSGMTDYEFALPALSSGIYFLQVEADGQLQAAKIFIAR